jgi:predicted Rossmann-fold nucleotide-binding protein
LFEALTLTQTKKIEHFPVVLIGSNYWQPLVELLKRMAIESATDAADLQLMLVTDDLDEAVRHLRRHSIECFALWARSKPKPSRWLVLLCQIDESPGEFASDHF